MLPNAPVVSTRLNYVQFGYYLPEEVRLVSVKEISNPKAFDKLGHPIKGGLYDPALGVQPHDRGTRCVTCGQENLDCPGHVGHIELLLPVYNPYLVNSMLALLRTKCFNCHRFRMPKDRLTFYRNKFKFLRFGRLVEMKQYEQLHTAARPPPKTKQEPRKQSTTTDASRKGSDSKEKANPPPVQQQPSALRKARQELLSLLKPKQYPECYAAGVTITSHILYELKQQMRAFNKDVNKKCPHCHKPSPSIRKEGASKLFINQKGEDKVKSSYINPLEIAEHIRMLFHHEQKTLKYMFGSVYIDENTLNNTTNGYEIRYLQPQNFFIEVLLVTANRFRPENKVNDQTFLHGHTVTYTRILELNHDLKVMITNLSCKQDLQQTQQQLQSQPQQPPFQAQQSQAAFQLPQQNELKKIIKLESVFQKWLELQDAVIGLFNSERAQNKANRETPGVKQLLERKQGLFRMKMMGKRVNYACRSVISPDPLLSTNEVGVPLVLAKKLIIPENVNQLNKQYIADLIMNGTTYPGAMYFQENGQKVALEFLNQQQRLALVRELGTGQDKVLWRHLRTGDVMLFNRQPSLHKPSIMGHIVRVLPNEQTIRFHYANCKSYNADFDGDEMNLHFIQNMIGRSEAYNIALNDNQYISQTNGKPLRELMQDMIISSVFLTLRDQFLTKDVYQQLIYQAVWNLFQHQPTKILFLPPAILRPKQLWTGKQVISTLMKIIVEQNGFDPHIGLNMDGKSKFTSKELKGFAAEDQVVIVRNNDLLLGVVDKNQLGSGADYGLIHAFHELYGAKMTGQLLTGMARLTAAHLQMHGFTCGMDDLLVSPQAEKVRERLIQENLQLGAKAAAQFCGYKGPIPDSLDLLNRSHFQTDDQGNYIHKELVEHKEYLSLGCEALKTIERKILKEKQVDEQLDKVYKLEMQKPSSEIIQKTLSGLQKLFPKNLFSCMTMSGAKGSNVNHSQVSVMLGQQELEGRRVPLMPSGRSLPSFLPYDPNPRAGGYVADRFLTGLRPQEFFFHCMAGREGLIDTAVKTSRSGYLQRCLVKHLEGLIVQYDLTVRDNDGSLIQLFYGEDGVDISKMKYLEQFHFLTQNHKQYKALYKLQEQSGQYDFTSARQLEVCDDTVMNILNPSAHLGAVSKKVEDSLQNYIASQQDELRKRNLRRRDLVRMADIRYIRSLIHPGEAVGCIAAQSIGEPSTQMTLNTFHLAGHGDKNVTLGIPRLRELLMTATKNQKTPDMSLKFNDSNIDKISAERYALRMSRLCLAELVKSVTVREYKKLTENGRPLHSGLRGVIYEIAIELEDLKSIAFMFGLGRVAIENKVRKIFVPLLMKVIQSELNKHQSRQYEKDILLPKSKTEEAKKRKNSEDDEDAPLKDGDEEEYGAEIGEEQLSFLQELDAKEEQSVLDIFGELESRVIEKKQQMPSLNEQLVNQYKHLDSYAFEEQSIKIVARLPLNSKKVLMTNVVRTCLASTVINEIKGISKARLLKEKKKEQSDPDKYYIYTEGVNLNCVKGLDFINPYTVESNDTLAILNAYGVEAARKAIINEVLNVFNAYGVAVDYRHLYLISDYMTFGGSIRAMNRIWMDFNTSPFGKMSFETSTAFLTSACMNRETDTLNNLSAQIVMGRVPRVGTNMCDVFYKIQSDDADSGGD